MMDALDLQVVEDFGMENTGRSTGRAPLRRARWRRCDDRLRPPWIPRSECWMRPGAGRWRLMAMSRASRAIDACGVSRMLQPTTLRVCMSISAAADGRPGHGPRSGTGRKAAPTPPKPSHSLLEENQEVGCRSTVISQDVVARLFHRYRSFWACIVREPDPVDQPPTNC